NLNLKDSSISSKASELKDSLKNIFQLASAQSKSLTDEYLTRQDDLSELIKVTIDKRVAAEGELSELNKKKGDSEGELNSIKELKLKIDEQVRDLESKSAIASNELRDLERGVNNFKLDLRTYEVNLQNASDVLSKADINISDINPDEYKNLNLGNLETSLSEVQRNISALGSVNLAAPEEYLTRQNDLIKLISDTETRKKDIEITMADLLQKSSSAEAILTEIRQKQSKFNESMRDLENKKSIAELDLKTISEKVTDTRLELKTYEINLENANVKIKESGLEVLDINYSEYEGMNIKDLQDRLSDIQASIIRLGAINLAAPEEIAQESKRKEELDIQYDDLTEALDKLSGAIKTIDNETKSRFKDSFDAVNARIKEVFPKLFGGGFAELTLTDDDALNAGVVLMARPPGKKNSSISQLSGGEKALTALALVFSIFELNPAPFCMLDEVDAPLDDLNTMRFINMVEEMSKTVQFIFITHNKVSMEKSDYLMGVTMQEAGVSRLVSVDVNQALEFAET
ncbi:recombination protein RecF, partial [Gammaproteobacteria bacterium]|nr:recombination protein RecF [Gammaproteobacteria bacterium]